MTEQQKRSLFFSATGKVATLNPFEYFIFCKGMDAEREACADMVLTLTCMGNAKECFEVAATYI